MFLILLTFFLISRKRDFQASQTEVNEDEEDEGKDVKVKPFIPPAVSIYCVA